MFITNAIKQVGYSIPVEQRPFSGTITLSPILWQQYVQEGLEWMKQNKIPEKHQEHLAKSNYVTWHNTNKSVRLVIELGQVTSSEIEAELVNLFQSMHKRLKQQNKKITNDLPNSTLPESVS